MPFTDTERKQVIEYQLSQVKKLAAGHHGVTLSWQQSVLDVIDKAFNQTYGVRSLKYEVSYLSS